MQILFFSFFKNLNVELTEINKLTVNNKKLLYSEILVNRNIYLINI